MRLTLEGAYDLLDARGRCLGRVTVEEEENGLLGGTFVPGPAFPEVEPLFRAFEEAADAQALRAVDRLDAALGALGLFLMSPDGSSQFPAHDVQIWGDGAVSCRVNVPAVPPKNGAVSGGAEAPARRPEGVS